MTDMAYVWTDEAGEIVYVEEDVPDYSTTVATQKMGTQAPELKPPEPPLFGMDGIICVGIVIVALLVFVGCLIFFRRNKCNEEIMETRVTPLRLDREDEKKMLPCRFFANGYCHKGNRCRFYHPLNMGMNSIIRVPPLPPHFSGSGGGNEIGRQSQPPPPPQQHSPASRIPQLFPMSPPMNGATRGMAPGMNGMVPHHQNVNYNYQPSPPSPPYMDYDLPPQPASNFMFDGPISAASPQNTVFNHIDWSEFLAPGQAPPPPTLVPDERHERMRMNHPESPSTSSSNEDMPPEGRSKRKLTAKEELQMKVKEIAKELAEEPVTPIHSLDSFFRNFTFNGYTASPKHKSLVQSENQSQAETSRASGDSHEVGGTSAERFSVRDMADALMEIYIASEREREGQQQQQPDEDQQSA